MAISETLAALQQNFAETKPDMKEIASSEDNLVG